MARQTSSRPPAQPVLEHFPDLDGDLARIPLAPLPFRIGRNADAQFVIHSRQVSKDHAVIAAVGDGWVIRDSNSTNGTFVNGRQVTEQVLKPGDIIHVAHKEFRFALQAATTDPSQDDPLMTDPVRGGVPLSLIHGTEALREIIDFNQVEVLFQPIVRLDVGDTVAFEALGRGTHDELSPHPADLFRLAEKCQMAAPLSRSFRHAAVTEAQQIPGHVGFFFNLHPRELEDESLLTTIGDLAAVVREGGRRMVLEVHEDAIVNTAKMKYWRERLRGLGIGLAYDDFGAGQSRLALLAEVPPDFVKLDMNLIRGIDAAPARQDLVWTLSLLASRLNVPLIAEGIETRAEADTCRQLGCAFGQGYLFARPAPAAAFARPAGAATRKVDLAAFHEKLRAGSR